MSNALFVQNIHTGAIVATWMDPDNPRTPKQFAFPPQQSVPIVDERSGSKLEIEKKQLDAIRNAAHNKRYFEGDEALLRVTNHRGDRVSDKAAS